MIPFLAKNSSWSHVMVRPDSALCVEGFPRSANTFTVAALKVSNPSIGHIARHSHLAGQVKRAVGFGVPTLLLVREPLGAVVSMKQRERKLGLEQLLRSYIRFHHEVLAVIDGVVVVDFKKVTSDFGGVIEVLNKRFELDLKQFDHSSAFEGAVFEEVEKMAKDYHERMKLPEDERHNRIARPETRRTSEKDSLRDEILGNQKSRELLEVANQLYQEVTQGSAFNANGSRS